MSSAPRPSFAYVYKFRSDSEFRIVVPLQRALVFLELTGRYITTSHANSFTTGPDTAQTQTFASIVSSPSSRAFTGSVLEGDDHQSDRERLNGRPRRELAA